MSDSAIPDQVGPAARWVVAGVALFVFFLIAAEKYNEGAYSPGTINALLFIVTFIVAVKWEFFSRAALRWRKPVAFTLLALGALLLAAGAYLFGRTASAPKSDDSQLSWLLPAQVAQRCLSDDYALWQSAKEPKDTNAPEFQKLAEALRLLLLDGDIGARGHRVILGDRGARQADSQLTTMRPGDWQRLVLGGQGFTMATSQDGIFDQYVALEMATIKPCAAAPTKSVSEVQLERANQQLRDERLAKDALARQLDAATAELHNVQHQLQIARQQSPAPVPPPLTGVFTKKTVRELRALYEGRTRLQADAFMADEKGKLIDVDGAVVNVDSGMAFLQVGNTNDNVECRFGAEWNAKLSTFRQGDSMKIRGIIGPTQNGAQIYLQQCELRD